jgi:tetratricopeptide (TPR) repeat protein
LYKQQGNVDQARAYYDKALQFLERTGDRHSAAKFYFNLGNLCHEQGQSTQAYEYFQKSKSLFEMVGDMQNAKRTMQEMQKCRLPGV